MSKRFFVQFLKFAFFISIGIFSIWYVLSLLSPDEKQQLIQSFYIANYWWVLLSMAIGFIAHWLRALRWNILIEPFHSRPHNLETFAAVAMGYLGNFIFPRFGEILRCFSLKKTSSAPVSALLGTVIIERIIDMLTFFILFLLSLFFIFKIFAQYTSSLQVNTSTIITPDKLLILVIIAGFALTTLIVLYIFRHKFKEKPVLRKLYKIIYLFKDGLISIFKIRHRLLFILYSVLIWVCYVLMSWVCFFAFEHTKHLPLESAILAVIAGTIGIIIVQGGLGVYPALVAQALLLYTVPYTTGYALGWIIWLSQTLLIVIIGLWAMAFILFKKNISIYEIRRSLEENNTT